MRSALGLHLHFPPASDQSQHRVLPILSPSESPESARTLAMCVPASLSPCHPTRDQQREWGIPCSQPRSQSVLQEVTRGQAQVRRACPLPAWGPGAEPGRPMCDLALQGTGCRAGPGVQASRCHRRHPLCLKDEGESSSAPRVHRTAGDPENRPFSGGRAAGTLQRSHPGAAAHAPR